MKIKRINTLPDSKRGLAVFNGEVRFIHPNWQNQLSVQGLDFDNSWEDLSPGVCVSESQMTNCFKIQLKNKASLFFKRYTYPLAQQKRYWMRASKAQVEVFGYRQLQHLDIPTLNVVAFGESRLFGKLKAAYIVTEGIDNSMDLEQFAQQVWFDMPKQERGKVYLRLREQIFNQLMRAHQVNFFHQDLHWRNILVTKIDGEYHTTWIDCPRAQYRKLSMNSRHGQMVDLSCLARRSLDYLSRSERYCALSQYLKLNNKGWTQRSLFKEIQAHHTRSPNPPKLLGVAGQNKQFRVRGCK